MPKIQFHTREYVRSHFKEPKGRGSWGFRIGGEVHLSPSMTYAEARKWAADIARAVETKAPVIYVDVLP